ncbi:hypothetical protein ACQ4M4_28570 [Leptolyngbya sp. AN02str]|uniref:hypothetical protein n=1 Tax=Leptolyngbya sp. AN02str TaxID=3423363 RepID=UPI003D322A52
MSALKSSNFWAYLTAVTTCLINSQQPAEYRLKDVECQYVFLREQPNERGDRQRWPQNPDEDFQVGEFEHWVMRQTLG